MLKQKLLIGISLCGLVALTGCVSEQTYVGSDKPVSDRTFDNIEAARTRISLGLNYLRRGDTSQAKYNLERARSFAPNSAEVYSALAYYYQSVGENKQAEEYFRTAISKDNNYADAYNNFGAFLCQLQRYDEAEQLLLKAISRRGYIRVAESYENLALCKLQQNDFNRAKTYLESSVSHNATRISSLIMDAGLSYAMGDNQGAKGQLDRIQRLGRVSSRTVLLSYLLAQKNDDRELMRNAEQLLLTLYIDTPEAKLLLQGNLASSEFEQLRERYKDSLMANIVIPQDNTAVELPAAPVANPQLKVVKRKTAAPAEPSPVTTTANNNSKSTVDALPPESIAKSPAVVVSQAGLPIALPAETLIAETAKAAVQTAELETVESETQAAPEAEKIVANATVSETAVSEPVTEPEPEQIVAAATVSETAVSEPVTEPEPEQIAAAATVSETAVGEPVTEPEPEQIEVEATVSETAVSDTATPFHLVQEGESLYAISVQHNIRLPRLMQWNELTPEAVIKTGQKIWLGQPAADEVIAQEQVARPERQLGPDTVASAAAPYHVVASGETMFSISYRYNVRLDKFLSWNNLTERSTLRVGQQVVVVDPASIEK
uniref:Type IV pilus biogenesis protein PilF n=1 Tax=Rheinheimera sp. BAL341 TaxID=1708203 RepID=A0A486XM73_9GAMM